MKYEDTLTRNDMWIMGCFLLLALGCFACQRPERPSRAEAGKAARATATDRSPRQEVEVDQNRCRDRL